MTPKQRRDESKQFTTTNAALAAAVRCATLDSKGRPSPVRAGRAEWRVMPHNAERHAKKLQSIRLAQTPLTRHSARRSFPNFEPGMSTRDYVAKYASLNGNSNCSPLWTPREYDLLNAEPAGLYEGGAFDFQVLIESTEDDELPDAMAELLELL